MSASHDGSPPRPATPATGGDRDPLFDVVFEHSPVLIAYLDREFNFIRVNRAYAAADGREPEYFPGRNHFALYPNAENQAIFARAVASGEAVSFAAKPFEYAGHPERGTSHWDWTLTPVKAPDGAVMGAILALLNVTEHIQAVEALTTAKDHFRHLVESAKAIPWELDPVTWRFSYIGPQAVAMLGYPLSEWYEAEFWEHHIYPDDRDWAVKFCEESSARGQDYDFDYRMVAVDGRTVWIHDTVRVERDEAGRPRLRGFMFDITARRETETRMRQLSRAMEQTADIVTITDRDGVIEYVNPAFESCTGYASAEALGRRMSLIGSGRHDRSYYERLWSTILSGQAFADVIINRRKDGRLFYEEKTITPLKNEEGDISHFVATGKDISERMQTQERLQYLAHHDIVTGLPNRALFADRLGHALARTRGDGRLVALLFLDVDRFKLVNDTLGHAAGDRALQHVAEQLRARTRTGDTVARFGGDEFAVLIEDIPSADHIAAVVRALLDALSRPLELDGHEFLLTASIGISLYPHDGADAETLLKNADIAMYRAKDQGRNTYQFYSADMGVKAFERLSIETSLRHALEREEFVLHYQPQVDVATGRIIGLEALLRWRHADLGLVAPAEFIPILEEAGLILPVGDWVLRTACTQARAWQLAGHAPVRVAVNLTGRQFGRAGASERVAAILAETGLAPEWLELEMTESVLIEHTATTMSTLKSLEALGLRLAVDDFGTGYSSLSYLKRFPVDSLKIDRAFIRDLSTDPDDAAIVEAIIAMAMSLGIDVVAEGVETAEQLAFLRARRCQLMQGFLFSPPRPAAEIPALLARSGIGARNP
jgi:diguanylate cyclase (GGDEF)-like protein/PAS domain S-box-containing protein